MNRAKTELRFVSEAIKIARKRALESYGRTPILSPARVSTMSILIGLSR